MKKGSETGQPVGLGKAKVCQINLIMIFYERSREGKEKFGESRRMNVSE